MRGVYGVEGAVRGRGVGVRREYRRPQLNPCSQPVDTPGRARGGQEQVIIVGFLKAEMACSILIYVLSLRY